MSNNDLTTTYVCIFKNLGHRFSGNTATANCSKRWRPRSGRFLAFTESLLVDHAEDIGSAIERCHFASSLGITSVLLIFHISTNTTLGRGQYSAFFSLSSQQRRKSSTLPTSHSLTTPCLSLNFHPPVPSSSSLSYSVPSCCKCRRHSHTRVTITAVVLAPAPALIPSDVMRSTSPFASALRFSKSFAR